MELHTRRCISLIVQYQCYQGFKTGNPRWSILGEALVARLAVGSEIQHIDLIVNIMSEIYGEEETLAYMTYTNRYDRDGSKRRAALANI